MLKPEQRACLDDIAQTLLAQMTEVPADAMHICRLCDVQACPQDRCPVHLKACAG